MDEGCFCICLFSVVGDLWLQLICHKTLAHQFRWLTYGYHFFVSCVVAQGYRLAGVQRLSQGHAGPHYWDEITWSRFCVQWKLHPTRCTCNLAIYTPIPSRLSCCDCRVFSLLTQTFTQCLGCNKAKRKGSAYLQACNPGQRHMKQKWYPDVKHLNWWAKVLWKMNCNHK